MKSLLNIKSFVMNRTTMPPITVSVGEVLERFEEDGKLISTLRIKDIKANAVYYEIITAAGGVSNGWNAVTDKFWDFQRIEITT